MALLLFETINIGVSVSKTIKNRIIETRLVDIDSLHAFQGEAKDLSLENFEKLRRVLIKEGFSFSCHAWHDEGKDWLIDGHQRISVLRALKGEGYKIPKVSCTFISAKNGLEAKKLVLAAISQYGKLNKHGLEAFIGQDDIDFSDFDFPDFDFGHEEEEPQATDSSQELSSDDFDKFDNQCPKCGFEFNEKK